MKSFYQVKEILFSIFHSPFVVGYFILLVTTLFLFIYALMNRKQAARGNEISIDMLELLEAGVMGVDVSNRIVFINEEAVKLLGITDRVLVGSNISEIIPDLKNVTAPTIKDISVKDKGGVNISLKISAFEITSADKKTEGIGFIIEKKSGGESFRQKMQEKLRETEVKNKQLADLKKNLEEERQKIEDKVRESTRNLREEHTRLFSSINNLNLGFIMTDKDKNIIMVNKAAKSIFFLPYMETGVKLIDLQAQIKGKIDLAENLERSIKEGEQFSHNDVLVGNKYTNIFISSIILKRESVEETIGAAILVEDKTEERLIEKSKENFFIIASHELRTPLTGIKGYIAIIKQFYFDSIKNQDLRRIIDDIDISSTRLINIVNDFLDTTKIEQDKITINEEKCDLIDIVKSSIKDTMPIADEKKLFVNFKCELDKSIVIGDKDRIKQIVINLISNGLKYSDRGGVTVYVEKTIDNNFKITVEDTGKGIPEENIKFLFSKYQQIESNNSKKIVSTGLGLYISKLLAEKMHGIIKLDKTEVNKGSVFSLSFPISG